jgi:hypothetical protein
MVDYRIVTTNLTIRFQEIEAASRHFAPQMAASLLKSLPYLRGTQLSFPLSVDDKQPLQVALEGLQLDVAALRGMFWYGETSVGYCAIGAKQSSV